MKQIRPPTKSRLLLAARRGTAVIEFALVLPIFVLLLIGLADLGFGAWYSMQVQAAAEAGAQYIADHAAAVTLDLNAIKAQVASATGTGGITVPDATPPTLDWGCPNTAAAPGQPPYTPQSPATACSGGGVSGRYAWVSAQLEYSTIVPWPGLPETWTLVGQAYRRIY